MLRKVLHSTLPIEMYHFPDEMQDKELREELEATYDLKLVEVSGKRPNGKSWSKSFLWIKIQDSFREGWWLTVGQDIKNAAFIHTQFTEFIYLDSVSPVSRTQIRVHVVVEM